MTCPSCDEDLAPAARRCRNCGCRIIRMESGVIKTSAVLVASGGSRSVYASLREVPEPLRTQVIASTSGRNAGTILIADRRGKAEIEKAARSGASPRGGFVPTPGASEAWAEPAWRRAWPIAVALLIVAVGAAAVFFARA